LGLGRISTVDAQLKSKEGRIVPDLKMDHPIDVNIPVNGRMANISTIPSVLKCLDVLAHAKSPCGELDVINDGTRAGVVSIGDYAESICYNAGALTALMKFCRAKAGHSQWKGRYAGKRMEDGVCSVHGAPLR
jgi:hypothetical protein